MSIMFDSALKQDCMSILTIVAITETVKPYIYFIISFAVVPVTKSDFTLLSVSSNSPTMTQPKIHPGDIYCCILTALAIVSFLIYKAYSLNIF